MDEHLMPLIVIESDFGGPEHLLDGAGAQVDEEQDAPVLEGEQQVVLPLARVEQQAAGLPGLEVEGDLVAGTEDGLGIQRQQVEGQVVRPPEGRLGRCSFWNNEQTWVVTISEALGSIFSTKFIKGKMSMLR
ncbi:hypothetical protein AVEN_234900-1 [Araneus ventricosus]|uniref:Uncharacterized protein n=1 Tax=Araneus ventricosus TaxID=182803 RepID=A0A4Y2H852_ARAVE|nr:hypothetical protein AVEN_234900-1 [Araneus ventricosus]